MNLRRAIFKADKCAVTRYDKPWLTAARVISLVANTNGEVLAHALHQAFTEGK